MGTRSPTTALTFSCDGQFDAVGSPTGAGHNILEGTAAITGSDVWSVGIQVNASNFDRTLAQHFDGGSWTTVATPNANTLHNDLFGVSAVSSSNVWAVGIYVTNNSTGTAATLALHWNGTSWTKVPTVNPSTYSYLFAVKAVSASSVWAVGTYYNFGAAAYNTLVEHYNGTSWKVVSSANAVSTTFFNQLFAVSALSDSDVWTVGSYSATFAGTRSPLAVHWDGTTSSVVNTADVLGGDSEILGVDALEGGHAVGVGYGGTPRQAERWDLMLGSSSATAPGTTFGGDVVLEGVARASGSLWAVGFARATNLDRRQTLVWKASWDSTGHVLTWAATPGISASPGTVNNVFFGVAAVTPHVFWAVGYGTSDTVDHTLTELYCALHFNVVAPANAVPGTPFSVTVTAKNADNSTATDYRGTVQFSSSDPQAVLPADYAFTSGDSGAHTFGGVVMRDTSNQPSSISVRDAVTPIVNGTTTIIVACVGVCQGPTGTPGGRDVAPGPAPASPTPRIAIQSSGGTPGPRVAQRGDLVLVSQRTAPAPRAAESIRDLGLILPFGLLVLALLALRRRRSKEKSNVR